MTQSTLFTSRMGRKKAVDARYNPNSYRVISYEAELMQRPTVSTFQRHEVNPRGDGAELSLQLGREHRKNRPNETNVGFLDKDVKLLNDPICNVHTESTKCEQGSWWPHRESRERYLEPGHPLHTTFRSDYQYRGKTGPIARNFSNPHKTPTRGSVPVNFLREKDGKQRFWREGISYEHQYNSRKDPQYPTRGRRHGAFVWDRLPNAEVDRMLHQYGIVATQGQQTCDHVKESNTAAVSQPEQIPVNPDVQQCQTETQAQSPSKATQGTVSDCDLRMTAMSPDDICAKPRKSNGKHVTINERQSISDSIINTVQGSPTFHETGSVLPPI